MTTHTIDAVVTSDDWQSDQAFYTREAYDDPEFQCSDDDDMSDADIGQLESTREWARDRAPLEDSEADSYV